MPPRAEASTQPPRHTPRRLDTRARSPRVKRCGVLVYRNRPLLCFPLEHAARHLDTRRGASTRERDPPESRGAVFSYTETGPSFASLLNMRPGTSTRAAAPRHASAIPQSQEVRCSRIQKPAPSFRPLPPPRPGTSTRAADASNPSSQIEKVKRCGVLVYRNRPHLSAHVRNVQSMPGGLCPHRGQGSNDSGDSDAATTG